MSRNASAVTAACPACFVPACNRYTVVQPDLLLQLGVHGYAVRAAPLPHVTAVAEQVGFLAGPEQRDALPVATAVPDLHGVRAIEQAAERCIAVSLRQARQRVERRQAE